MADATDPVWIDVLPSMRNFGSELAKGAGKAADDEGGKIGKRMGVAIVGGIAIALGGAAMLGKSLAGIGETFSNLRSTIVKESGASGAELDRLVKVAQGVGTQVPASFDEIGPAVAAVRASIGDMAGVTDQMLTDVTRSAMSFSKAFEIDVSRATQVAGQMMKTGLAKDGTQAFDLLTAAAQKVPPALREDILDAVDEYSPAFKQMGLSGESAMGLLVKASEKGMYGIDKTGDALKELGIRMTTADTNAQAATESMGLNYGKLAGQMAKGGEEGRKAFDSIVSGLQGVKDPAKQAELAMALFGTPLEDLNAADIPKFLDGLRSGATAMQGYQGATERMAQSLIGPREQMQILGNRLMVAVKPAADAVFGVLSNGIGWLSTNAVPAVEGFIAGWMNFSGTGGQVRAIAGQIFDVLRDGMNWITGTAIPAVQGFLQGWRDYSGVGGETRAVIEGVISAVRSVAGTLWENRDAILVVAGVITALLIPGWIMLGVQATISAVKQGAAWVATQGKAVASAFAQSGAAVRIVAGWVMQSAAAIKSGAETAAIWLMLQWDAIKSAAAQVAAHARTAAAWAASKLRAVADAAVIVGQWILMGAQATQSAAIQVAAGARTAAIWVGQRLAMLGHLAVMGLVRGATIAWTATQWLLNAALNANPIGLIVIGLMLLVGAIVYAWNNSETFRRIVMAAWDGIKAAASATVNWFVNTALPFLQGLWNNVVAGFVWLKDTVIGSIMALVNSVVDRFTWWRDTLTLIAILATLWVQLRIEWLRQMVVGIFEMLVTNVVNRFTWWRDTLTMIAQVASQWVVDKVTWLRNKGLELVRAMVDGIVDRFNWWRDTITSIADTVKNWVLERIEALKANAMNTWQAMVDGIARIWDGLKKAASDPVRFVVDTVINNGIIKGWNDLVGLLKLDGKLKVGRISVPGFDGGGWTGPGSKYTPAGVVHADEFVVRKESRRAIEQSNPGLLDYMNRTGSMPGYAAGGRVHPVPGWPANMGRGYHGSDRGIDIPAPMGTPVVAMRDSTVNSTAKWGYSYGWHVRTSDGAIYAHMSDILVAAGQVLKAGQQLGRVGNTGNSFGPHLHVTTYDGASPVGAAQPGGGSGFDPLAAVMGFVTDKLSTPVKALIDKIPGAGVFVDVAKGLGTRMLDSAIEKIKALGGSAPADADQRPGVLPPGGAVERWRPVVLQALRMMNQPESYADLTLRRLNQESSGNPGIVNNWDINARNGTPSKGLMQVIDPTFRAYAMPGYSSNIFDPLSNILASMRYALARYGSLPRAYNRPGGYWRGTNFASPGVAWVGERGPELIDFRGGERVYDAKESKRFSSGGEQHNYFQPQYAEPRDPQRDFEDFAFNVRKAAQ